MRSHADLVKKGLVFLFLLLMLSVSACQAQEAPPVDRQPAVAGAFYPGTKEELSSMLGELFRQAVPSKHIPNVIAVIAPHAGYEFSGGVAASSFNQIDPDKEYENVFILGSSHYVLFDGASIYRKGNFITPLGTVSVNRKLADQLIQRYPFFNDRDDAHDTEHCIEVQVPFLQARLKKHFSIVPIVIATQTPETIEKIADALKPYLTPKNLFVISTDFSHYPSYADAVPTDKATADAILTNSVSSFASVLVANNRKGIPNLFTSACGWTSVMALLNMTQGNPEVSFTHIDYKNSGDAPGVGDKARVVGYNSIVVSLKTASDTTKGGSFNLNDGDKKALLGLARRTVEQYVSTRQVPELDSSSFSESLRSPCGAFVTLNENSELRGCIGRFDASQPLYKVVQEMAVAAATEDYRFTPVQADEVPKLHIEISVLTPMRKIHSIDEIEMGKHGIYIRKGSQAGTFLPQVAKETGWSKEEFLGHCAEEKAGLTWDGWKDAELYVYEALVFGE